MGDLWSIRDYVGDLWSIGVRITCSSRNLLSCTNINYVIPDKLIKGEWGNVVDIACPKCDRIFKFDSGANDKSKAQQIRRFDEHFLKCGSSKA